MATRLFPDRQIAAFAAAMALASFSVHDALAQVDAVEYHGNANGRFGSSLADAGDVDGDGIDDLLVGEPFYDSGALADAGRICVYSGATHSLIRSHEGGAAGDELGLAVSGAGDVDLDGRADYVVGSWAASSNGLVYNGRIVVYSGKTGSVVWSLAGAKNSDAIGYAVAGVGDADGDGRPDVLASSVTLGTATLYDEHGNVIDTVSGSTWDGYGSAVAACGDLDGDGQRDFMVSAPVANHYNPTIVNCGQVVVYSTATATKLFDFFGPGASDYLGYALGATGDVDGDGSPDLLAGSLLSYGNGPYSGLELVASGADGSVIRSSYGAHTGDRLGTSICGIGDLDQDGVDDYVVGAPDADGGSGILGLVRAQSGSDGSVIWEWWGANVVGSHSNQDLGAAVAGGDFNGDGVPDVVTGDPLFSEPAADGSVVVYLGCPAWWRNYGAGWPGKMGVPNLVALNDPEVGSPLSVQLDNSLGANTVGLLFIGLSDASISTNKGGTILVDPLLTIVLPIPSGGLLLADALPNDPALYFLDVYLQAIEVDAFASKKLSFTPGLQLHCGFDLP